jgi:hypothetical protein
MEKCVGGQRECCRHTPVSLTRPHEKVNKQAKVCFCFPHKYWKEGTSNTNRGASAAMVQ